MAAITLRIEADGTVRAIHSDAVDWRAFGRPDIRRASHVEPDADGRWHADLSPVGGPTLGPFEKRSEALEAEAAWIDRNLIAPDASPPWNRDAASPHSP